MKTLFIIILVAALIAGAIWVATKYFGLFSDSDKDGIPDEVEDAVAKGKAVVKETKRRAKLVKQELGDVADSAKDVIDQTKDVLDAAKGKPRRGRKPKAKK
jgi:hypothetical protein